MADLIDFPALRPPCSPTASYQAYRFASDGSVRSTLRVAAGDDGEAERHAVALLDGHRIELWSRGRFVAHVRSDDSIARAGLPVIDV